MEISEIIKLNRDTEDKILALLLEHEKQTGMRCELTAFEESHETTCGEMIRKVIKIRAIVR